MLLWIGAFRRRIRADAKRLGRWGERQCEKYLKRKGFRTLARNFRCRSGEIDLVTADTDGAVVFVEVKTRTGEEVAKAQEAVGQKKQKRMIRAANSFIKTYGLEGRQVRFDVVAVVLGQSGPVEIRHYERAFVP